MTWVPLGDEAQGLIVGGKIVAVTYAENVGQVNGSDAYELCWLPVEQPDASEVLFGVGEGAGEYWDNRWDRARTTTEWLYAEWLDESRLSSLGRRMAQRVAQIARIALNRAD